MKNFAKICLVIACVLLAGCSDASATVKNGSSALITVGGKKVTKEAVYELLRAQDQSATALKIIKAYIADKEIETTDEITETAKAALEANKATYGDSFSDYISYLGFKDEDDYYQNSCLADAKYAKLEDAYLSENWDALVQSYWPSQVQILETKDATAATDALAKLQAGTDFAALAADVSTKSSDLFDGQVHVVSANNEDVLPTFVQDFIKNTADTPTLSGVIQNDTGDTFYIVNLLSKDTLAYKDEAVAAIKGAKTLETEMMAYYYKKYKFHTYDVTLRDYLKENYPTYLNQ